MPCRIVPYIGYEGDYETIAVKEGGRTRMIVDVTRQCSGRCPPCLNAMYDGTMPDSMRESKVARELTAGGQKLMADGEALVVLKALAGMDEGYFQDIKKATDFALERAGVHELTLTGGEPTIIGSKLIRLLDIINDKRQFSQIKLLTHAGPLLAVFKHYEAELKGQPYKGNMLDELIERGLTELTISRHHDDEGTNHMYMGKAVPNDEKLRKIIVQAHASNIPVRFSTLVEKGFIETVADMGRFARWAKEMGVDEIIFRALAQTGAVDKSHQTDAVAQWVQKHLVSFDDIAAGMADSGLFVLQEDLLHQNIKSRGFYKFDDMPVALEFKHDPGVLQTDAGVFTAFPDRRTLPDGREEHVTLAYRWVEPQKHSINYYGEDWTAGQPYFRPGINKEDKARKYRVTALKPSNI